MALVVHEIGSGQYPLYDNIPTWFRVESIFRVEVLDGGLGGFALVEETVAEPYLRDFDAMGEDNPTSWSGRFDTSEWGLLVALEGDTPVGGATIAVGAPVYPMDRFQRKDLAVLWDLRVHPEHRGRGIGSKLFLHAADWARQRRWGQLGLETDSANVPACRFYTRHGCELGAIHRFGYAGCPDVSANAMLLWYLDL
jgi:GNAT superfamily N-acetyltransferase